MKKIISILFILMCLTGCWNYKELDDYSIVTGIAIDKKDDDFLVSVLISNAKKDSSSSNSSSQNVVYSGKGDSIFKALKQVSLISPKELYLDHFSILILSEQVAKEGIYNISDFFLRYPNARKDFSVVIAKDCKASDTLKIVSPLTDYPSQSLSDNIKFTSELQGTIFNLNYNELIYNLIADGKEVTMSSIKIIGDIKDGSKKENLEESAPETYLKLSNLYLFKGDKLVDSANTNESIGINIINNKINEMNINVKINDGYVVVNTISFNSKTNITLKNNKPYINIKTSGTAKIMEVNGNIDLSDHKTIKKIEKLVNNKIKKYMNEGIYIAKSNNTDIFGFGLKFNKNYPNYFNKVKDDWNNYFKNINIKLDSNVLIKSISSTQNNAEVLNDKE